MPSLTDARLVAHGHPHDEVVRVGDLRAPKDAVEVRLGIAEGDVARDAFR